MTHYAPLVVWIIVILGLGGQFGSMNETSRFIRPLLEFLFPSALPETLTALHGGIRKFAHFAEYAVLGVLAFRAFSLHSRRLWWAVVGGLVIAFTVASIDEFQQSFLPERTSSPYDVLIDLAGAVAAVILAALFTSGTNKKQHQGF